MSQTPSAQRDDESPFWRFSLRFYARPQIAAACLVLQDEGGADVNLLLFLLFLAEHGRRVGRDDIARLDEAVHAWRDSVIKPLRELRRALKAGIGTIPITVSEGFRGQMKRLELESEQIEQHMLERIDSAALGAPVASHAEAAEANLAAYGAYLGTLPAESVATILSAFAKAPRHPA